MPGHDPVMVADLVRAQADLKKEGAELLQFVGDKAPAYFGVQGDDVLVALAGWSQLADPADYLLVVPRYK